jgi:ribosomal protein L31E
MKNKKKIEVSYLDKADPVELRFIKNYLQTGSPTKAAEAAKIGKIWRDNRNKAATGTSMMTKNSTIRGALKEILEIEKVSVQSISKALSEEIFEKPAETPPERTVRLKAIEMVSKMLGLFDDKNLSKDDAVPIKIVMSQEEEEEEEKEEEVDMTLIEDLNEEPITRIENG